MPFVIVKKKVEAPNNKEQLFIKSVEPEVEWTEDPTMIKRWDDKKEANAARDIYKLDKAHVIPW